jgi:hypothetical protein
MEYLILIHSEEQPEGPGTPEFEARMGLWMAYNQMLVEGGHFVAGASLMPVATATTVRSAAAGDPAITDGPYAETKEQLGGFYVVAAADLDEALALAARVPVPATLEVRPIAFRPDAPQ